MRRFVGLVMVLLLAASSHGAEPWSFAIISDIHHRSVRAADSYESVLKELSMMTANPEPRFPKPRFVVAAGDVCLAANNSANWRLWLKTFPTPATRPGFFPCLGNHDEADVEFINNKVLKGRKGVSPTNAEAYRVDHGNVRIVLGRDPDIIASMVTSAPARIEHIFVANHYPAFAREVDIDHIPETLKALLRPIRSRFWKMLVANRARVRAYLCGHTHHYSRLRIADPDGADVDNREVFPNEQDGIWQISAGNSGVMGHSDGKLTITWVLVDGKNIRYRVVQKAHNSPDPFCVVDSWEDSAAGRKGE